MCILAEISLWRQQLSFYHGSSPAWASAVSALPQFSVNVPKPGVRGATAVITEELP